MNICFREHPRVFNYNHLHTEADFWGFSPALVERGWRPGQYCRNPDFFPKSRGASRTTSQHCVHHFWKPSPAMLLSPIPSTVSLSVHEHPCSNWDTLWNLLLSNFACFLQHPLAGVHEHHPSGFMQPYCLKYHPVPLGVWQSPPVPLRASYWLSLQIFQVGPHSKTLVHFNNSPKGRRDGGQHLLQTAAGTYTCSVSQEHVQCMSSHHLNIALKGHE